MEYNTLYTFKQNFKTIICGHNKKTKYCKIGNDSSQQFKRTQSICIRNGCIINVRTYKQLLLYLFGTISLLHYEKNTFSESDALSWVKLHQESENPNICQGCVNALKRLALYDQMGPKSLEVWKFLSSFLICLQVILEKYVINHVSTEALTAVFNPF